MWYKRKQIPNLFTLAWKVQLLKMLTLCQINTRSRNGSANICQSCPMFLKVMENQNYVMCLEIIYIFIYLKLWCPLKKNKRADFENLSMQSNYIWSVVWDEYGFIQMNMHVVMNKIYSANFNFTWIGITLTTYFILILTPLLFLYSTCYTKTSTHRHKTV